MAWVTYPLPASLSPFLSVVVLASAKDIGVDWDGEVARLRDAQDWDAALAGAPGAWSHTENRTLEKHSYLNRNSGVQWIGMAVIALLRDTYAYNVQVFGALTPRSMRTAHVYLRIDILHNERSGGNGVFRNHSHVAY